MEPLIFDTSFLIDFQWERKKGAAGAHRFLEQNAEAYAYLPIAAYAEYAEGFESLSDQAFISVVESYEIIETNRAIAERYAVTTRDLRMKGQLIGSNDLWIAATALHCEGALVTRNIEHFSRVPGLRLAVY